MRAFAEKRAPNWKARYRIVADTTAQFGLPEVTLGVIPGAGGPARLTRAIGKAKAMYHILTGETIGAEEAERMGIITKVVEDGTHLDEALRIGSVIAANPRLAVLARKEAVNQQAETPLAPGLSDVCSMGFSALRIREKAWRPSPKSANRTTRNTETAAVSGLARSMRAFPKI